MSGMPTILNASSLTDDGIMALIYAPPGMGKTTLLGMLPGKTLILDVDCGTSVLKGLKNVDIIRMSEGLSELKTTLEWLKSLDKIPYDNICIDTITELEAGMLTVYGRKGNNDGAPEKGHYNKTQYKIMDYCRQYRDLGINFIVTAWESQKEIIDQSGEKYTQAKPMLSGQGSDKICGLCDIVGRLTISKKTKQHFVWMEASQEVIAKDRVWKRPYCKFSELFTPVRDVEDTGADSKTEGVTEKKHAVLKTKGGN